MTIQELKKLDRKKDFSYSHLKFSNYLIFLLVQLILKKSMLLLGLAFIINFRLLFDIFDKKLRFIGPYVIGLMKKLKNTYLLKF